MPIELSPSESVASQANQPTKIAIVVSEYNNSITSKLCRGAVTTLVSQGILDHEILIVRVPGAWELTYATQQIIRKHECRGVIVLGAVIKGETTHDQHLNRAVSMGLMQLSIEHNKPIGLGLLTVNSLEQAIQRSGGSVGNKGEEAAAAMLACLRISRAIDAMESSDEAN
jgi:6,7-dimethyl-8-ribityllumazine synthase